MPTATAKTTTPVWTGEELTRRELYDCLMDARGAKNVEWVLGRIGMLKGVGISKTAGAGYRWEPFGANLSNWSTIGLGKDPGRAIVERVTNAIDAAFECERPKGRKLPSSPREAAKEWFGRPETGPETGLFNWKYGGLDELVTVHILESDGQYPTLDIEDHGIGITPEDFERTILSLQGSNKITKLYLAGAFGQGGASSIAFSKYTIIQSRHRDNPGVTGFTVIRELELGGDYKENAYAYLTDENGHVMWIETPEGITSHGTTVRHIEFKLEKDKLGGTLISSPGNLYHYLNAAMFDPLLPFRVIDHRDYKRERNEVIRGSRNRLMRNVGQGPKDEGTQIAHHKPMEYLLVGDVMKEPSLGLEYWVVFSRRKPGTKDPVTGERNTKVILRPQSNEIFVQRNYPIVFTVNGQVHGEISAKFLRDIGLPLVSKHCVIHLDASKMPARLRRDLFSTTREGFREGPLLTEIQEHLKTVLLDDEKLFDLEQQLADRIVTSENVHTSSEVKAQVIKLLVDANFKAGAIGTRKVKGTGKELAKALGGEQTDGEGGGGGEGSEEKGAPFIASPFPEVENFVPRTPEVEVPQGRTRMVGIDTDASREFADRGLIALRSEPDYLDILSFTAPKAGGFTWRVRPKEDVAVGAECELIAALTKPNGEQIEARIQAKVTEAPIDQSDDSQGSIPEFEVVPVAPSDIDAWSLVWPELMPGKSSEADLAGVAYKAMKVGESLFVYYSSVFAPFAEVMEKYSHRKNIATYYRTAYEIWISYHAIKQFLKPAVESTALDVEEQERLAEKERALFAEVQARQSQQTALLQATKKTGGED